MAGKRKTKKRGLPNLVTTPEALKAYKTKTTAQLFEKYGILSARELSSRYNTYLKNMRQKSSLKRSAPKRSQKIWLSRQ